MVTGMHGAEWERQVSPWVETVAWEVQGVEAEVTEGQTSTKLLDMQVWRSGESPCRRQRAKLRAKDMTAEVGWR